jgi:flagellar basal body rod protein FlgG
MEVISNNLANAQTVGYKPEKTFYSIYNRAKAEGRGLPLTPAVNDGTLIAQSGVDFSQGSLRFTKRSLDLAIEGNGFFTVRTPQGTQATRDGQLQIGLNGQLQTRDGAPLLGKNNLPIQIDPAGGTVTVQPDGTVQQGENTQGQINIQSYANPNALRRAGSNRFDTSAAQPVASTATVTQGALEQSTVDLPTCMIDMIQMNRMYEMSMKVASTVTNDMDEKSITDISTGH